MRFTTSPIDHRVLTMLPHTIARTPPARREIIHGRILGRPDVKRSLNIIIAGFGGFAILVFIILGVVR